MKMRDLIRLIESHTWEATPAEVGRYMWGGCHVLALAIHRITGFPLRAIVQGSKYEEDVIHVMVRAADDLYMDIRGLMSFEDILTFAREEGEIEDTTGWRVIAIDPAWIKAAIEDGLLDPIRAADTSDAKRIAKQIINILPTSSKRLNEQRLFEGHGVDPRNIILRSCVSIFAEKYWDRRPHVKAKNYGNEAAWEMFENFKDELPEEVQNMDAGEAIMTPEFKRLVLKWAQARFRHVERKLSNLPHGAHGIKVARVMRISLEKLEDAKRTGTTDLGVHWTFDPGNWDMEPIWADRDSPGINIYIDAEVQPEHVDWFNTYMANMDYFTGDLEEEIRVQPGAPILVHGVSFMSNNEPIDVTGIRFTA